MSFPSTFGSQVSAIMDVLARAAVAEITKLVEDGTLVLRLEMRQKDNEIQELQRSLKMMEVELCKAREAVEEKSERTTADLLAEEPQFAGHQVPNPDSLSKREQEAENDDGTEIRVKPEPVDDLPLRETTDGVMSAAATLGSEPKDPDEPIWPLATCGVFEDDLASTQMEMFPLDAEQFSAHRSTQYSPTNTALELTDDSFSLPFKVKVEVPPVSVSTPVSEPVHVEPRRHASQPVVSQSPCSPSVLQHVPPHPHRPSTMATDCTNRLRVTRATSACRVNQRLFSCSGGNKSAPRGSQLEEYRSAHLTFKPFRCLECGKSFTQKTRLKSHQSVHTGERPFSCKICGKKFSRHDNCLRHERFHTGLKPFSCGQCGKSFTVQANLRIHQVTHLQGR